MTRIAVIGGGLIGAGWAVAFSAAGHATIVVDPHPVAPARVRETWKKARPVLERLGRLPVQANEPIVVPDAKAVTSAEFVQEALPESLDLKRTVLSELERHLAPEAVIASSSSSFTADEIAARLQRPENLLIGHPCNPPYLMPTVEISTGSATSCRARHAARAIYEGMGKTVLDVGKPLAGHLVNRLQAALWREMVHLVVSGTASLTDVERAVTHGLAPRWCLVGPTSVFALAGAEDGMAGFVETLGPQFQALWDDLGAPRLEPDTCRALIAAYEEAALPPLSEIASHRDQALPALLELLSTFERPKTATEK